MNNTTNYGEEVLVKRDYEMRKSRYDWLIKKRKEIDRIAQDVMDQLKVSQLLTEDNGLGVGIAIIEKCILEDFKNFSQAHLNHEEVKNNVENYNNYIRDVEKRVDIFKKQIIDTLTFSLPQPHQEELYNYFNREEIY
jgi:hypothetical protein